MEPLGEACRRRRGRGSDGISLANLIVDFAAVHRDARRRGDSEPHAAASNAKDAHLDPVADDDRLMPLAREDQHDGVSVSRHQVP